MLHVVDILPADGSNPVDNYLAIESELKKFNEGLFTKPRILAINKVDLIEKENINKVINKFVKKIKYKEKAFNISALNGFGCKSLVFGLSELIERENDEK